MHEHEIKFKHREINKINQCYVEIEEWFNHGPDFKKFTQVELVLEGDRGKGCCTLLTSTIVHFEDQREPETLDLE